MDKTIPISDWKPAEARWRLVVVSGDTVSSLGLPENGEVAIGRADDCELRIDVPSLSRRHASLAMGPQPTLKDLGSSNGTRFKGRRLSKEEQVPLAHGDTFEVGTVTLLLQRQNAASWSSRGQSLWGHAYLEGRLEEECLRAQMSGVGFWLLRLKLEGTTTPQVVLKILQPMLGVPSLLGEYGPGEYEAIVFGSPPDVFLAQLGKALTEAGARVRIGHAVFGPDGKDPDQLMGAACARVTPGVEQSAKSGASRPSRPVVADPQMETLHAMARKIAASDIPVLLMGETGVGKEIFAEEIHQNSHRRDGPFLRLNCAALAETLLESELFGHEKGAFTGATKTKVGLLESATGGTVFLDEAGEMPASTQAKLLRVLEAKEIIRVGDVKARPIDVRFVSATHQDLEAHAEAGTFRRDLYFRLNGVSLLIPPLRQRTAELEGLARHFISLGARALGRSPAPTLSPEALELMRGYHWPGNLRELRNVLDRATLLCNGSVITPDDLPKEKLQQRRIDAPPASAAGDAVPKTQRDRIIAALETHGGNQTLAAKELGISRRTMLTWLDTHDIPRPRKKR